MYPVCSGLVFGLLHLAIREDILPRILHDLTLVACELPRKDLCLKDLIKLLKTATLSLWHEEVEPNDAEEIRPGPDVSIFWTLSLC